MFFVNREEFRNTPTMRKLIKKLSDDERASWENYYNKKRKSRPEGRWRQNDIPLNLEEMFWQNCAYCGRKIIRGEVDHFLPKFKQKYDRVYDWDNYLWSCHDCNSIKSTNEGLINPCCAIESKYIRFNKNTGYFEIKEEGKLELFDKTVKCTVINEESIVDTRKKEWKTIRTNLDFIYDIANICENPDSDLEEFITSSLRDIKSILLTDEKNSFRDHSRMKKYCIEAYFEDTVLPVWIKDEILSYFDIPLKQYQQLDETEDVITEILDE